MNQAAVATGGAVRAYEWELHTLLPTGPCPGSADPPGVRPTEEAATA